MKVALIPEKCIACGLCQTYSNIFDYQDDGIVKFSDTDNLEKEVPNSDQDTVLAVKSCPPKLLRFCKSFFIVAITFKIIHFNQIIEKLHFSLKFRFNS